MIQNNTNFNSNIYDKNIYEKYVKIYNKYSKLDSSQPKNYKKIKKLNEKAIHLHIDATNFNSKHQEKIQNLESVLNETVETLRPKYKTRKIKMYTATILSALTLLYSSEIDNLIQLDINQIDYQTKIEQTIKTGKKYINQSKNYIKKLYNDK